MKNTYSYHRNEREIESDEEWRIQIIWLLIGICVFILVCAELVYLGS